jgi:predicted dehydrogenase
MSKIIFGVAGLGVGAFHLQNLLKNKKVFVKTICDFNQMKLSYYQKKYKIKNITKNINDIINDKDINAIVIATNDNFHCEQILKSLKKNKHVFAEKPICLTSTELKRIINFKKKKPDLILSTNLILRKHPFFKELLKDLKKTKKNYYLEGEYNYGRLKKLTHGWRSKIKDYSITLGGGIHIIDLILQIKKNVEVKEIFTLGNKIITKNNRNKCKDLIVSLIKFEDGSIAKILCNFSSKTEHHHVLRVFNEKFSFFYSKNKTEMIKSRNEKVKTLKRSFIYNNSMKSTIINNFIETIKKGKKELFYSEEEIFNLMKICFLIDKSLKKE